MAAHDTSDSEKSLAPSEKRLREAREQGQIARSRELSTLLVFGGTVLFLSVGGLTLFAHFKSFLQHALIFKREQIFAPQSMSTQLARLGFEAFLAIAPLLALTLVAAIAGMLLLGGWNLTTKPLAPNFSKLNFLSGLQRMFSLHSLGELTKAGLAVLLLSAVVAAYVWNHLGDFVVLTQGNAPSGLLAALQQISTLLALLVIPLIGIAGLDATLAWRKHYNELKMTPDEVKREQREMEGNPEIKARIRQQQREMAKRRMMQAVPTADVVVTNPTHYAVALKYEEGKMRAPRVVAKGVDLSAARIRGLAAEHQVKLVEAPKLARALYANAEIDGEIPLPLYTAVAQVLAFVYQLRAGLSPGELGELNVPDELDPQRLALAG